MRNPKCIVFLVVIAIMMTFLPGCDKGSMSDSFESDNSYATTDSYERFIAAFDSLNAPYLSSQRGGFSSGAGTAMADYGGYAVGGCVGSWVGGALGSLTGNPLVVVFGSAVGRKVGPAICGSLASGIAHCLLESSGGSNPRGPIEARWSFEFNRLLSEEMDSIGYYHNLCMTMLQSRHDKYFFNDSLHANVIYDDVLAFYQKYGIFDPAFEDNLVKTFLVSEITVFCEFSKLYDLHEISYDEMIDSQINFMQSRVNCENHVIRDFREFGSKIARVCGEAQDSDQIINYAKELNEIIEQSDLTLETKEELAGQAQFIINSSLFWHE